MFSIFKRIVKKIRGIVRKTLINAIQSSPISSKYIGPPKGYYFSAKDYYDFCKLSHLKEVAYIKYLPSESPVRKSPISIYKNLHWKFSEEYNCKYTETFVISIPNGRVLGGSGTVITHDDKLLFDVSLQFDIDRDIAKVKLHRIFNQLTLPECRTANANLAVILTAGSEAYFHWLTDALPRFAILKNTLGDGFDRIDKFLISKGISAIAESLSLFGIPDEKLMFCEPNYHVEASCLIVPSLPGDTGVPPKWVCNFLRENFLKYADVIEPVPKLYISRANAKYRRVRNEAEVETYLNEIGFKTVRLEEHSFTTQIALFANADIIVAPHGAGLTNLVFAKPGTRVVEVFSPNYVNVCFWSIANQVDLSYFYLIGTGDHPPVHVDPHLVFDDMTICLDELRQTLQPLVH